MSFFKKLKDRLFRSSSKLEEGIDHIVKDGGVEDTNLNDAVNLNFNHLKPTPEPEIAPEPTPEPEIAPEPTPDFQKVINSSHKSTKVVLDDGGVSKPVKSSFFKRIIGNKNKSQIIKRALDDEMLEALEELLIASDMGVETAVRVTANLAEGNMGKRLSTQEVKGLLANQIAEIMDSVAKPMPIF